VTLMCSDASSPLALAAAQDLPARALALRQMQRTAPLLSDAGGAVLLDGAVSSYALYPARCFPAPHFLWLHLLAVFPSSRSSSNSNGSAAAPPPTQLDAAEVAQRMRRITLNYHALELLGRERNELDSGLPWPLGIIDAVRPGLAACT
jgi:hypothetical protein